MLAVYFYFVVGMILFWSALLTVICLIEKRMVWPYGELESRPVFGDPLGYGQRTLSDAEAAGFTLRGWTRDLKGKTYRVSYAMIASPAGDVLAIVGVGSIMRVPLNATWLFTRTSDGRCLYSADHQNAIQIDPSGHWKNQLVPGASFERLLGAHRTWIGENRALPFPFTPPREIDELRNARVEHYRFMQRAGMINFTDTSLSHFRFTFRGALITAVHGYFLGMARKLSFGRFPRTA